MFVPGGAVAPEASGSLADGNYQLTIFGAMVAGAAGLLDGDGNGTPGGDRLFVTHRLFGHADGDRDVDATDFAALRTIFGTSGPTFDNDGDVDAADGGQFRIRFGSSV